MRIYVSLLIGALFAAVGAYAQEGSNATASTPASSKSTPNVTPAAGASPDYKIGAQDVLRIDVWKEPDISRSVPGRPDGKISLPLLNDVQAAGLTSMQLAGIIRDGLTKYITSPQVTVIVTAINSRRGYSTGEVTKPGALLLLPGMTA